MRVRETETVEVTKAETRVLKNEVTCDMCGRKAEYPDDGPSWKFSGINWDGRDKYPTYGQYDIIAVQRATGYVGADGSQFDVAEFHICPACWEKLVGFVEQFGATRTVGEEEW